MPRELRPLLQDIAVRSQRAREYAEGESFERFLRDRRLQDAIERNLQIIGEALSQAVVLDQTLVWKISGLRKIVALRHLLTHHYYKISPIIIWEVVRGSLPQLQREVKESRAHSASMERPNADPE